MAEVEFSNIQKTFPGDAVALEEFNLKVEDGEFLVIVGPSGCGKSTALRIVAGLDLPSSGEILIGGKSVNALTPQERNIAMVFQNYALYPHKTVRDNLDFPLRMMGLSGEERNQRIEKTAGILGLQNYLDRKPRQLSGGQRQRAAMGRALVRDPVVFLMDEPLSNLDAKLRVEIRAEMADLQREIGITTIYVTHDQVEAMTLGDRVAVLKEGRLQQVDPPQHLYDHPANVFVATFIGSPRMNVFRTRLEKEDDRYTIDIGGQKMDFQSERHGEQNDRIEQHVGQEVLAGFRPEAFQKPDAVDERYRLKGQIETIEALGHEMIVYFESPVEIYLPAEVGKKQQDGGERSKQEQSLVARLPVHGQTPQAGQEIELGLATDQIYLFDADGEQI